MKLFYSIFCAAALLGLFSTRGLALPLTGISAQQAMEIADTGIDPSLQNRIVSVYGTGTTSGIDTWWVIFYDSSVDTHGRAVKVTDGKVARTYPAEGGVVYADSLTFGPGDVRGIGKALAAAEDYSASHNIRYNQVRALLRLTHHGETLHWRVQLLDQDVSKGFVFVDAGTGTFVSYSLSGSRHHSSSTGADSVADHAQAAGEDVKDTFLGIGGTLQQFFTGERTVDK